MGTQAQRSRLRSKANLKFLAMLQILNSTDGASAAAGDPFKTCSRFRLRWFTPTTEVPLCGHATLASAAALIKERGNRSDVLRFETLSGVLEVTQVHEAGAGGKGEQPVQVHEAGLRSSQRRDRERGKQVTRPLRTWLMIPYDIMAHYVLLYDHDPGP